MSVPIKFTNFVQQKIRIWFKMLDTNKNGSMGLDDFTLVADRFGQEYELSTEERAKIQKWLGGGMKMLLEKGSESKMELPLFEELQKDMEQGQLVCEDRFITAFGQFLTANPAAAELAIIEMMGVYFDIFDHDKDGVISPEEMMIGLKCFGMEQDVAEAIGALFDTSDALGSSINRKTYVDMWVDFLVGENRSNPLLKAFAPNIKLN